MDYIFIVFGHYIENNEHLFDVMLVTRSEDKCKSFIKESEKDHNSILGYYKYSWGTFDIE